MSDFDFVNEYAEAKEDGSVLPDNEAECALNCAFVGIGGGGGKLAKAFIDLGFSKTVLVNTTDKDFELDVEEDHLLPLPGLDGVAKNVEVGQRVLSDSSAVVEDALRTKLGEVDWLFVCVSGGGGTGSAGPILHETFKRYLSSVGAEGRIVYIATKPTAQELLNDTVAANFRIMADELEGRTYILLDNERQLNHLRGKVGISGLYPAANAMFAKMLAQMLKLANEPSPIQAFDSKDLARFLSSPGRILIGTAMLEPGPSLGSDLFQKCVDSSPCPKPEKKAATGVLLEIISDELANDPDVGGHLEAASAYVGGRSETMFSGVYVYDLPEGMNDKLISVMALGGLDPWKGRIMTSDDPLYG